MGWVKYEGQSLDLQLGDRLLIRYEDETHERATRDGWVIVEEDERYDRYGLMRGAEEYIIWRKNQPLSEVIELKT